MLTTSILIICSYVLTMDDGFHSIWSRRMFCSCNVPSSSCYLPVAAECMPGSYSNSRLEPCVYCQTGTYQDSSASSDCILCPQSTWTTSEGSASADDCTGTFLTVDGASSLTFVNLTNGMTILMYFANCLMSPSSILNFLPYPCFNTKPEPYHRKTLTLTISEFSHFTR